MTGPILAIDQSTSATKTLLFSQHMRLLDKKSVEHRQIYPQAGFVEHDAEEIWRNTQRTLAEIDSSRAQFLSLTNQRETIVCFERATGQPLRNAIVWQCRRGAPLCAELAAKGFAPIVERKTGLKLDTYFSASKIQWLMACEPQIARRLEEGSALLGTIDTYLIYRLTAGRVFATDHSNASRTLLYDINRCGWDEQLCAAFGVPRQALPEIRDSTAHYGTTTINGRDLPIIGVIGDSQGSLFAHRCYAPGSAKVTLGSGCTAMLNIGQTNKPPGRGAVSTIAWSHQGKPTYCFEGIVNFGGATLVWLRDQLGLLTNVLESESIAQAVSDNGGVYLVPAFAGLSAPHWQPNARAALVGLSAFSNKSHIIRAAVESIAFQVRDLLEMMRESSGLALRTINADGGPTRNKFLMQFLADITGLEVVAADIAECSPLGAALLGSVGSGAAASIDALAGTPDGGTRYRPAMPAAQVDQLVRGWQRAVKQVLVGVEP